jgi:hypothetical protein
MYQETVIKIPLSGGKAILIDGQSLERIAPHKWYAVKMRNIWYAITHTNGCGTISMHRLIMEARPGQEIDHINGNGLDNRRINLRLVTRQQNLQNQKTRQHISSYKGVSWERRIKRWKARITHNYQIFYLGCFKNEKDAARAYNRAALHLFGEYARLNEIETGIR